MTAADSKLITCFDIGGSYIRYGTTSVNIKQSTLASAEHIEHPEEQGRIKTPTNSFPDFIAALRSVIIQTHASAISISLAGAFDSHTGIADIANIPCLNGRRVETELSQALSLPVTITNDGGCFALAEAYYGAGKDATTSFSIILGTGVGGGIVFDKKLVTGFGGIAGEWGHGEIMDPTAGGLEPNMPVIKCGCSRTGCVDPICSARGLESIHQTLSGDILTSIEITKAWIAGEPKAIRTVNYYSQQLARALSMIVNLLGPEAIPAGGGLAKEPRLIANVDKILREMVLANYQKPLLQPGHFVDNGGLVGAAIVARQNLAAATKQNREI